MSKDRRLGKGLAALLGTAEEDEAGAPALTAPRRRTPEEPGEPPPATLRLHEPGAEPAPPREEPAAAEGDIVRLDIVKIDDNPFQPRRKFDEADLASLAESLAEHDMLQPILVRRVGDRYQLISGERRLRAAIKAGWSAVPAQVREADDRLVAELALVENLQREDLNPIDKALAFQRYIAQHRCTQEELAQRVKINRATIANFMRLLDLPEPAQTAIVEGRISAGHARALLPLGEEAEQLEFCRLIEREGLSVRDVERMVKERLEREDGAPPPPAAKPVRTKSEQVAALEQELRMAIGAKVEVRQTGKGRGRIVVHFKNHEEFERVFDFLTTGGDAPAKRAS